MTASKHLSEGSLILAVRQGNSEALRYVYKTYWPMILQFVRLNNGSSEDAEELYQEGIITVYEKLIDQNFTLTCSLKTFIYAICRNKWFHALRGKARITDIEDYAENIQQEETVEEDLPADEEIRKAISNLGNPCKEILIGFYYQKMSLEQLASQMSYSSANVAKQQKFRCMERLKKAFLVEKS